MKAARGEILDRRQSDAARLALGRQLDRAGDTHLADRAAALPARGRLLRCTQRQRGLIDLDQVLKQTAIGVDHGAAQLVQQQPGTLVAAEPELRLELKSRDAVRVAGHDVNRREPGLQRQMTAVHDRACGDRGLLAAGRTFPARPATLQFPAFVMAATGADEAIGPSLGREVAGAGGLIGKARLEAGAGQGAVMFPAAGHAGTLHEHAAPGKPKPNMSLNRNQRDKPLLEFELDEGEIQEFKEDIKSNLNGTLPLLVSFGQNSLDVTVKKPGRGGASLTKKSTRIAAFVSKRIRFEYIPAIRTAESADQVISQLVEGELYRLEENEEYTDALTKIEELQSPVENGGAKLVHGSGGDVSLRAE